MTLLSVSSDWHIDDEYSLSNFYVPNAADIVVLAGDIGEHRNYIYQVLDNLKKPTIYILGNRCHKDYEISNSVNEFKERYKNNKFINILDRDIVYIDDIKFIGCTLWTDCSLNDTKEYSQQQAYETLKDIKEQRIKNFDPYVMEELYKQDKSFIFKNCLRESKKEKIVVGTHYVPSRMSITEHYYPNYEFSVNELSEYITYSNIDLWIHGNLHYSADYTIADTRVICNPKGNKPYYNKNFNKNLLVEV
jgi:predicted phosphodiesterase